MSFAYRKKRGEDAMEISHTDYHVSYDAGTATVTCQGSFRLQGSAEYEPILQLLTEAADAKPTTLTLDVRALQFLNSSGINTLSKFVLHVRKYNASQVVIKGSSQFPWQQKSLKNFQRLLPGLHLEIE
jgi:hypothetical protein